MSLLLKYLPFLFLFSLASPPSLSLSLSLSLSTNLPYQNALSFSPYASSTRHSRHFSSTYFSLCSIVLSISSLSLLSFRRCSGRGVVGYGHMGCGLLVGQGVVAWVVVGRGSWDVTFGFWWVMRCCVWSVWWWVGLVWWWWQLWLLWLVAWLVVVVASGGFGFC